jgi:Porin PorA
MRKGFGIGLTVLGGFLVTLAILAQFWAPGQLMKTPLDTDSLTLLDGTAQLSDGTGGTDEFPIKAFSVTRADSERSDGEVIVFQNSSCLVKDEGEIDECVSASDSQERLLSASTDNFATDRRTGEAVDDPKYLPPSAEQKEGLVNKWPFEAEKETYQYWDSFAGEAVDATYDRTEQVDGLETYVYKIVVDDAPIEVTDGVQGTYSTDREIWIDPTTGAIVNQFETQERLDGDGNVFLALDYGFTDEQVADNAETSKSNAGSLNLISNTVPLIGWIVGIPALLIGIALQVMRRRSANATTDA